MLCRLSSSFVLRPCVSIGCCVVVFGLVGCVPGVDWVLIGCVDQQKTLVTDILVEP